PGPVPLLCKHAAFVDQPSAKNTSAIKNITRNGVRKAVRPIIACRPTGPPTTSDSAAPRTSVRLGQSRSSAERKSAAKGRGETLARPVPTPVTAAAEQARVLPVAAAQAPAPARPGRWWADRPG